MLLKGMREFLAWLGRLFRQPIFLFVTVWGHAAIFLAALVFHFAEQDVNPKAASLFHSYYWAIATATTVGSSDVVPMTVTGKIVAILLMVTGSLFLWSYTALFAASYFAPAVTRVGREVEEVEREVKLDQETLATLLRELEELRNEARRRRAP